MDVEGVLRRLGGCASTGELRRACGRAALRRARRAGSVVRVGHGRYVLATVAEHRRVAHRHTAALSHLSSAQDRGWKVVWPPDQPWMTVPRNRKVAREVQDDAHVVWRDLTEAERRAGTTSPVRTVLDCATRLPFAEALAVADSALRAGDVTRAQLVAEAGRLRGNGAAAARRVAEEADARAANPLESVLRAIALETLSDFGVRLIPQLLAADTGLFAHVDLGHEELKLAVEAEGFEAHSSRRDLHRDARRYTELTMHGWTVLRYSWEDVMLHPEWVAWTLRVWWAERHGLPVPDAPRSSRRAVPA